MVFRSYQGVYRTHKQTQFLELVPDCPSGRSRGRSEGRIISTNIGSNSAIFLSSGGLGAWGADLDFRFGA